MHQDHSVDEILTTIIRAKFDSRVLFCILGPLQCSNCLSANAKIWCDDCKNNYCSKCSETIHALPAFKSHGIDGKPMEKTVIVSCEKHPDEKLKYWCKGETCQTLICRDCLLFEHKNHEYTVMEDVINQLTAKVRKTIRLY